MDVHLKYADLLLLARDLLPTEQEAAALRHLEQCEFCREALEERRMEVEMDHAVTDEPLPPAADALRDRLFTAALAGTVISLVPLDSPAPPPGAYLLAADGAPEPGPAVECLREYCSERPELVLRLMRSGPDHRHWVQLVADDPELSAHVLLRLPEMDRELLTDAAGRAELPDFPAGEIDALKWEVKLPDVSFTLDELAYDPDRTEYAEETVIESARADRVRVRFEGKTEGKQVTLEFLNLVDIGEGDAIKVYIVAGTEAHSGEAQGMGKASFRLSGSPKTLAIRLFRV